MKLTTSILAVVMMTGAGWAQNPDAIDNTRSIAHSLQQIQTNQTNAALEAAGVPGQPGKPGAGQQAPAVKPATIPGAAISGGMTAATPVKAKAEVQPAPASAAHHNTLVGVNVERKGSDVQIEFKSRDAVTPKVSKMSSPARVVVELPATAAATAKNKIPFGDAGVKGVRIGMDGKNPPTTSVVVDLEQAYAYELTPGTDNNFVLTLHTQAAAAPTVAKNTAAPALVKTSSAAPKLQTVVAKPMTTPATPAPAQKQSTAPATANAKPHDAFVPKQPATPAATAKIAVVKPAEKPVAVSAVKAVPVPTKIVANEKAVAPGKSGEAPKPAQPGSVPANTLAAAGKGTEITKIAEAPKPPKPEEKKWAMSGSRDPFFSPVVQQPSGPGCSTGKKCLEIGQINVRGVVKSENGFIAVVTNSLNKAYFLHENDPVFNGYVVKITGDSVVFSETVQDKLGKPFTREVTKRITTPAV